MAKGGHFPFQFNAAKSSVESTRFCKKKKKNEHKEASFPIYGTVVL